MKFSELLASGSAIGPSIAERAACDACGHEGCLYRPFRRSDSYRAFAVCPVCDETIEF